MGSMKEDGRFENIVSEMNAYFAEQHDRNRKRIRAGIIVMILLPFVLGFIRWMTDSDKVLFLIIWVFCMFAAAVYLIGAEYFDYTAQKTIAALSQGEELQDEDEKHS